MARAYVTATEMFEMFQPPIEGVEPYKRCVMIPGVRTVTTNITLEGAHMDPTMVLDDKRFHLDHDQLEFTLLRVGCEEGSYIDMIQPALIPRPDSDGRPVHVVFGLTRTGVLLYEIQERNRRATADTLPLQPAAPAEPPSQRPDGASEKETAKDNGTA
jgi:hypothetical protein